MEHATRRPRSALQDWLTPCDEPSSVPERIGLGRAAQLGPLPGSGLPLQSTVNGSLMLIWEEDKLPPASAESPCRVIPLVCGVHGGHPQAATAVTALPDMDIAIKMAYHRHQYIGMLLQVR